MQEALYGTAIDQDVSTVECSQVTSAYISMYYLAGASFFYKPGTVSYEAQEVRAFGLFLADLLARMDACDNDSLASTALQGIRAACLNSAPAERPRFQQIASHCHTILEVCSPVS